MISFIARFFAKRLAGQLLSSRAGLIGVAALVCAMALGGLYLKGRSDGAERVRQKAAEQTQETIETREAVKREIANETDAELIDRLSRPR